MQCSKECPKEDEEQAAIFVWSRLSEGKYPALKHLNSSLNGVRLRIGQAMKAKRLGLSKGYPDVNLPVVNKLYSGLYIELKRVKGGSVSKEQKDWIEFLNSQGYKALVCRGSAEAIKEIKDYLSIPSTG